jgi:selenocysteine lyase/cysteine desulfurase
MSGTPRRTFLRSAVSSALAVPALSRRAIASTTLPEPSDPHYWDKIRDQFLLARDKVFFNNGTIGAMPRVVVEAVAEHLRKMATDVADWDYRGVEWIAGYGPMIPLRTKAARLVNADVHEVSFTENVTEAMSFVADGLDLSPGDEVLMSDQEHPGGLSPWLLAQKRRKVVVNEVKLPKPVHSNQEILDIISGSITPQTKVIAISHVITGSGAILPVKQIAAEARSRGIFTVFDGAQALGHIPVDVRDIGCDAYVSCFHKWLLAPAGTGFLYVRRGAADRVWTTLASSHWDDHEDDGFRLMQRGTGSLSLLVGLEAALDFHFAIGPGRVQQRIKYLGDSLREGLRRNPKVTIYSPEDPALCAGITVYNVAGLTGPQLQDEFWARGRMRPRSSGAVYGVRHSTHIFNSPEEIDRAVQIVNDVSKGIRVG